MSGEIFIYKSHLSTQKNLLNISSPKYKPIKKCLRTSIKPGFIFVNSWYCKKRDKISIGKRILTTYDCKFDQGTFSYKWYTSDLFSHWQPLFHILHALQNVSQNYKGIRGYKWKIFMATDKVKENAGIGSAWKKKERETEEEEDWCDEGQHGEGWCWGRWSGRQDGVEVKDMLWGHQIGRSWKDGEGNVKV